MSYWYPKKIENMSYWYFLKMKFRKYAILVSFLKKLKKCHIGMLKKIILQYGILVSKK